MADTTTIQINRETKERLDGLRVSNRDTYNDIIENLIEDSMELSDAAMKDIEDALEDIKQGRVYSLDDVKKSLGI